MAAKKDKQKQQPVRSNDYVPKAGPKSKSGGKNRRREHRTKPLVLRPGTGLLDELTRHSYATAAERRATMQRTTRTAGVATVAAAMRQH